MFKNLARLRAPLPAAIPRFFLSALLFAAVGSVEGQSAAFAPLPPQPPPLKAAFVYVSPIGEAGWTYQHEQGRLAMQKALGPSVVTTAVEGVAEGADSERVMRDLAAQGNTLIFATSFGYLEPALRVAAEHPEVVFEQAGGYKSARNLGTYNARYYEARYLAGLIAGKTSRTGIAGYVAGFPVPEVVQGINAFAIGMREANPAAQVNVVWLNTWFDPVREREAAQSLVDQGADLLTNHSGSPAVLQTAQANFRSKGVRAIAYQSDMRAFAPDAQLAAVTHHWGEFYTRTARAVIAGTWTPQPVWGGMKDGLVQLSAVDPKLPGAVQRLVEWKRSEIVAGRFLPFAGPLVDNQGRTRIAAGSLDDAALTSMDWFVNGVVGAVPKR